MTISVPLVLVIAALVILVWIGLRYASPRATAILPDDPLWIAAVQSARATLPEMRELYESGREVWVKFPLETGAGSTEHVWGRIRAVENDILRCTLETAPIENGGQSPPDESVVPADQIEDWQVEFDDGSIRGGFTTRAQAEIARRQGTPVPRHVDDMIRRMRD